MTTAIDRCLNEGESNFNSSGADDKTTRYLPHQQRAQIRFLYDRFAEGEQVDRYVSDFECHVYYPRELELLFRCTGFDVERVYGDYWRRPFGPASRQIVMVGRRRIADCSGTSVPIPNPQSNPQSAMA